MKEKFDFEEINLIPQKCVVNSRSECDTSIIFGGHTFKMPIVPANMECVMSKDLAFLLAQEGYFYIMHRFGIDFFNFVKKMKEHKLISSISIGVNKDSYELMELLILYDLIPDFITIDIAHGHSIKMQKMLFFLKSKNISSFIIAGNVCTLEAVEELVEWGADSVKVGISPGSACSTWNTTGFGSKNCQASTIFNCSKTIVPIIADGGIRFPADIAKSIVLGATMIMIGGLLSGFQDSPGNLIDINGTLKKEFWGSASKFQSNKINRIEGKKNLVDYKDRSILTEYEYLQECLQSSISYGGGKDLKSLLNVKWF